MAELNHNNLNLMTKRGSQLWPDLQPAPSLHATQADLDPTNRITPHQVSHAPGDPINSLHAKFFRENINIY